jgi:hypothetical protein
LCALPQHWRTLLLVKQHFKRCVGMGSTWIDGAIGPSAADSDRSQPFA